MTLFEKRCILFNQSQSEVGSSLKTLRGSKVGRCPKYKLGKRMSNKLYFHKDYIGHILSAPSSSSRSDQLDAFCLFNIANDYASSITFNYNVIRWDAINKELALEEVPNFDTEREPAVGRVLVINQEGLKPISKFHNQILHHKWIMVDNNYCRFDVKISWEWSRTWLSVLTERADGTSLEAWQNQLEKFNLQ